MYLDVLIFAAIAAALVYRLYAVLGTRHGDEKPRPNPFAAPEAPRPLQAAVTARAPQKKSRPQTDIMPWIDPAANKDGRIETGLEEIAAADPAFDVESFMAGAKYAFEAIVSAYGRGDREGLKPLLSEKLFADFDAGLRAREEAGHTVTTDIHRIRAARIIEAHLGGAIAYITVDYDVEQTSVTRDRSGVVVEGSPDSVSSVEDIWTFMRDIRSDDPNWMLIETRAAEK